MIYALTKGRRAESTAQYTPKFYSELSQDYRKCVKKV